jgi:predicted anti-sigma-YlaC factor YlaD
MSCLKTSELLSLYLDSRLNLAEEVALRAHLAACPACQAELESLQRAEKLFSQPTFAQPSALLVSKVSVGIRRRRRGLLLQRGAVLALLGLVTLASLVAAPLLAWSTVLFVATDSPAIIHTLVSVIVHMAQIARTMGEALALAWRMVCPSPTWLAVLCYLAMAALLVYWWMRLVSRPAPVRSRAP